MVLGVISSFCNHIAEDERAGFLTSVVLWLSFVLLQLQLTIILLQELITSVESVFRY